MTPESIELFLERFAAKTRPDERVLGVAIAGSVASNSADQYSDLDLQVVITDEAHPWFTRTGLTFARDLGNLLVGFTGEHVGEPSLFICLYDQPLLHVDIKFTTYETFSHKRVEDPVVLWERDQLLCEAIARFPGSYPPVDHQWIEDRFWVWIHYAATKVARGELLEAIESLSFIRQLALAPMVQALCGKPARGCRFLERDGTRFIDQFQRTLVGKLDPRLASAAIWEAVKLYLALRDEAAIGTVRRNDTAEQAVRAFLSERLPYRP